MIRMGKPRDRYERRSLEDRQKMRAAYRRHALLPDVCQKLARINAALQPEETHEEVYRFYRNRLRTLTAT
jgi:thymidylate kinase